MPRPAMDYISSDFACVDSSTRFPLGVRTYRRTDRHTNSQMRIDKRSIHTTATIRGGFGNPTLGGDRSIRINGKHFLSL